VGKSAQPVEIPEDVTVTYQSQRRACGKANCHVCLSGKRHGPYWYAFWHETGERSKFGQRYTQGRLHSMYFGSVYPELAELEDQIEPEEANVV
jgi:hypothetical protein